MRSYLVVLSFLTYLVCFIYITDPQNSTSNTVVYIIGLERLHGWHLPLKDVILIMYVLTKTILNEDICQTGTNSDDVRTERVH